jgi:hypothetical protein
MTIASVSDIARNDSVAYFSPEDYLINILKRATNNKQDVVISHAQHGAILLMTTRGEYFQFPEAKDMAAFCAAPASSFRITVLEKNDPNRPTDNTHGRNIDELLWQAGFHASQGRLMEGCKRDDVVQLRHWPNLSRLPMTANTMRITSFFTRYPTSIMLAGRILKIEPAELYQFYTAARCAGIAHVLNRKPEEPMLKPHRNQALLGMLLNKIAGL